MEEKWIDDFCNTLEWLQRCWSLGSDSLIGFYADKDFKPELEIDIDYERKDEIYDEDNLMSELESKVVFGIDR